MKPLSIALVLALAGVAGCQRYGGSSLGSYGNPDRSSVTAVLTQRDPHGSFLFVVAWTATNSVGTVLHGARDLVTEINGRPIHPDLQKRAVYAFQPDGSLKEIPLAKEQITALFQEMQNTNFHTSHSRLWQEAVSPRLLKVEVTGGS
jgi:hypothetical protein